MIAGLTERGGSRPRTARRVGSLEGGHSVRSATCGHRTMPRTLERRVIQAWSVALILLCAGYLWLTFRDIRSTLPYPQDVDEGFVAGPATRTLTTGTLHPYNFRYPSLS